MMNYILDTHVFLWMITDAPELSNKAKSLLMNMENTFILSVASVWEMAIKSSLGKLEILQPFGHFINEQIKNNELVKLDINISHAIMVHNLPYHHRDPFDRLIIAQTLVEGVYVISADTLFDEYGVKRIWN